MQHLNNELIASPDDGGLLAARQANTNDVIISDAMLRYSSPPQLSLMSDNQKMICCCDIYKTLKYFKNR